MAQKTFRYEISINAIHDAISVEVSGILIGIKKNTHTLITQFAYYCENINGFILFLHTIKTAGCQFVRLIAPTVSLILLLWLLLLGRIPECPSIG